MSDQATAKKPKRIRPELPAGFRDYGPADAIAKQGMIDVMRMTFERFGFDPLETSSVQRTEVLTGGEEDSGKIIFNVKGSQEQESESDSSLRFDLTVPLARFMAANPDLPKPFKRYQIGTVWRGERPQAGRYREFMQADVDIVGSSSIGADAEIAMIIYTVFKSLGFSDFVIRYNNRKLLDQLPRFADFPEKKIWEALRIIDKKDKIGSEGVRKELQKNFIKKVADKILEFLSPDFSPMLQGDEFSEYEEIKSILGNTGFDWEKFKLERSLVRGLSYYTGSVFEVILTTVPEIGSVCGGGRYDDLISQFTGQKIPAVGVSFGVDRLFAAMEKLERYLWRKTRTQVLMLRLGDWTWTFDIGEELRNAGINTALYVGDDQTFEGQLAYALKKEIPYVVIYGPNEAKKSVVAIKNLITREQKEIPRNKLVDYFKKVFPSP